MKAAAAAWDRFWFAPAPTSTLAVFRIAVGALLLTSAGTLWPDVEPFYGLTSLGTGGGQTLTLILAATGGCVLVGYHTRLAAAIAFVCLAQLSGTNPFIFNSGDTLLRLLVIFLALSPAGAALSVDCLRTHGTLWHFPKRPVWSLRLVQLQVAVMYAGAVMHKLGGETWRDGTAASYPIRIPDMVRFPVPEVLADSVLVAHVLTWGTLAVEAVIPLLVWSRRARPWVLGLGVVLHLSIDYSLRAGLFSWIVLAAYLAFVPPETMNRVIERVRSLLSRARAAEARFIPRRSIPHASARRSSPRPAERGTGNPLEA